jgi:hypothetical protein
MNYFASEVGLTDATKKLWAARPAPVAYPGEFKYQAPVHPEPVAVVAKPKRANVIKLMKADIEAFRHHRIYSVIQINK